MGIDTRGGRSLATPALRELQRAEAGGTAVGWRRLTEGGPDGNELLTSLTASVLLVLLAVEGVTILRLGPLISVHMFVGMLLIPPVLLKMASTGYRFARYYTHDRPYRLKGPPQILLRVTAPFVVASTLVVFVTGVLLLVGGPAWRGTVYPIHKDSFFVWLAFTGLHVLGHLSQLVPAWRSETGQGGEEVRGRAGRTLILGGAILAGAVLAVAVIPLFHVWAPVVGHHHHLRG